MHTPIPLASDRNVSRSKARSSQQNLAEYLSTNSLPIIQARTLIDHHFGRNLIDTLRAAPQGHERRSKSEGCLALRTNKPGAPGVNAKNTTEIHHYYVYVYIYIYIYICYTRLRAPAGPPFYSLPRSLSECRRARCGDAGSRRGGQ